MSDFELTQSFLDELATGNSCPFPLYTGEITCGSLVLVCYTMSTWYNSNPLKSDPHHELSCNLIFVVLFGLFDIDKVEARLAG